MESIKNTSLLSLFSIAIISVILITSQSNTAFAGVIGGEGDPDGDGWFTDDNCPFVYNPDQADLNEDGIGDACVPPSELVDEVIVVVEDTLGNIEEITAGELNSIVTKLEKAADQLDAGHVNGATGSLNAFINQIEALINSGQLDPAEGQALIDVVQEIIDAIN